MKIKNNNKIATILVLLSVLTLSMPSFAIVENVPDNVKETVLELNNPSDFDKEAHSVLSLKDCIELSIKYNPKIRAAVYNEMAYKTKVAQAWSNFFPTLDIGTRVTRSSNRYSGDYLGGYTGLTMTYGYVPSFSANMLIFDFGKTKAQADLAKSNYDSKHETTKENVNTIIESLKVTYYNILFAQAQVKVYEDTVNDFDIQLKQARAFYSLGKKAKIDVLIAGYNKDKANLNLIKAQNVLKKAKVNLANLMGLPEFKDFTLSDEMTLLDIDDNFDNIIQTAYTTRPELLSAEKLVNAAKMQVRVNKREYTPNLNIYGGVDIGLGTSYNLTSGNVGAGLSYSGLNILKTKKKIDESNYLYDKALADYDNVKNDLYNSVKQSYIDVQTSRQEIVTAKSSLDEATEQYRQATGRYKSGISDAIELKDGENTYLNARLDFYNAMLHYNTSIANLEKQIGAPITFSNTRIINFK